METSTGPTTSQQKLTPLMQQYWDIKSAHEDKVVLFRMGDFFEMFHRDAEIAAPVLGIALTCRNKKSNDETPMCGVPHHSVSGSINKLLSNGFKVAICDQLEDPKFAKGLVKRGVTRILSPGVVYDPDTLDSLKPNFLASLDSGSVSFLDMTTGEAFYFLVKDQTRRWRLIESLQAVEIVIPENLKAQVPAGFSERVLVSVHDGLGPKVQDWPESARRLLGYAIHMQGGERILETIAPFEKRDLLDRMELPQTAIRHLEVFETYKGEIKGSLFHAVNRCKTSAGARLLRHWLQFPLAEQATIESRLNRVEHWFSKSEDLKVLRSALGGLGDVQRRMGKIGNPSCNPRDLVALSESLKAGLEVSRLSKSIEAWSAEELGLALEIAHEVDRVIVDEPPVVLKNGGLIRKGVSSDLDELIELSTNSHQLILDLEASEREKTGISSLKIRFNNVFGYYIEITHTHKDKVPTDRYERKQTLANAERYSTPELAELEQKVLSAQAKRLELEVKIFEELVARCLKETRGLLKIASRWAEVDVVSSLAWLAIEENYVRPRFSDAGHLNLKASRHPVIEQALDLPFVANDIELPQGGCLLLTGPNMAGKSTLMRQVACASLMAQVGSFVAAKEATLPLFDRLYTRIGASDSLSEGLSTFMVEMKETAEMLESVSEKSLVILDEVGRGTSTYDGMSLAQAILEHILETKRSMTLFATHYHEMTELSQIYPQLHNGHMSIHEKGGEITFLHQLAQGPANKSYGIHVGKLAGLPGAVTRRAGQILKKLESGRVVSATPQMSMLGVLDQGLDPEADQGFDQDESSRLNGFDSTEQRCGTIDALSVEQNEVFDSIKGIDLSRLTPLEAINRLAEWQRLLGSEDAEGTKV